MQQPLQASESLPETTGAQLWLHLGGVYVGAFMGSASVILKSVDTEPVVTVRLLCVSVWPGCVFLDTERVALCFLLDTFCLFFFLSLAKDG